MEQLAPAAGMATKSLYEELIITDWSLDDTELKTNQDELNIGLGTYQSTGMEEAGITNAVGTADDQNIDLSRRHDSGLPSLRCKTIIT